jgi:dipeptidyl aminopeptidase/acylaminoacyl peptidase
MKKSVVGAVSRTTVAVLLASCAIGAPVATAAAPPEASAPLIPREALFGNPSRSQGRISPDGAYVSWLAPLDGVMNVWVAPAANPTAAKPMTRETKRGIQQYGWAPDGRHILFVQDDGGNENFRVYSVEVTTGTQRALTPAKPKVRADLLGVSRLRPDVVLVGLNDRNPQLFDLYEVDYRTGAMKLVETNPGFGAWVTDNMLKPRFALAQVPGGGMAISRKSAGGQWEKVDEIPADDVLTTSTIGFNLKNDALYMVDSRGRDTAALIRYDLPTGKTEVLATNARSDIAGLVLDPVTYEPLAYSTNYMKNEWVPLNDTFKADLDFLKQQLPGELAFAGMTNDGGKAVIVASSAERPATYYVYDRRARTLAKMFETRPDLAGAPLQPMHPVVIPSRDALDLVSYLTLPPGTDPDGNGIPNQPVPLVLNVHGGPWARDAYGYNSLHQWLANRGYASLSVNYRSSTGFGKKFLNAGVGQWSGKMHDDLLDAVDWAVRRGITRPEQVAIFGGSYGGYATLVGLTFTPDRFACGIDIVGPSNLATLMESFPPYWRPLLESTFYRHIGDPTNPESRKKMMAQSPITRVEAINRPLLIAQGANDPRVVKAESDQIVNAMKTRRLPVTYVLYPDEGHGFGRPENSLSFTAISEGFLSRCLGGRYEPIGDDFRGSSLQVLEGADHVPGLREALAQTGTGGNEPAGKH